MIWIQATKEGVRFRVKVQPKASQNEVSGLVGDALKLRLTAPPVDGEANGACIKFLAKTLGVSRSQLEIATGDTSRTKTILVKGMTEESLRKALGSCLKPDQKN